VSSDGGRTWRIVGNILQGQNIESGVADVIFPSPDTVLVTFSWTTPPWARQRIPICAAVIDREWFYRPVPRRLYRRAHPKLYPSDDKRSLADVKPLEPDAPTLKDHLVLWLKADAIDTDDLEQVRVQGADVFVKTWVNSASSSAPVAVQDDPVRQPKYLPGGFGAADKPLVRFDGRATDAEVSRSHALSVGAAADWNFLHDGSAFTVVVAVQTEPPNEYLQNIVGTKRGSDTNGIGLEIDNRGPPGTDLIRAMICDTGQLGNVVICETPDETVSASVPHVFAFRHENPKPDAETDAWPGGQIWIDGQWQVAGDPLRPYGKGDAAGPLTIGDRPGNPAAPLDGDLAEVIIYSRALSDEQIERVQACLARKYGGE
jgi:hypothetical protein